MASGYFALKMTGDAALLRKLDTLPTKLHNQVSRSTLAKGASIVAKAMRATARAMAKDSGVLAKSIGQRKKTVRGKGLNYAVIGPMRQSWWVNRDGVVTKQNPANYAHLVEFGTGGHKISTEHADALKLPGGGFADSVRHPGSAPRPFMRTAWSSSVRSAEAAMAADIRVQLAKVAKASGSK